MNFYMSAKKILDRFLLRCIYRCKVSGRENVPPEGGVIIASNHLSMHDVIIISAACERQVFYMAKKELFSFRPLGAFLKMLGAFPVDRKKGAAGLKTAANMISSGKAVGIFPQGTRCKGIHPRETEPRNGVGMLALRFLAPVVPVSIICKKFRIIPIFRRIELRIGKPILPGELSCGEKEGSYELAARKIFDRIISMCGEEV